MKKSELRQIIREEIQNLTERKIPFTDYHVINKKKESERKKLEADYKLLRKQIFSTLYGKNISDVIDSSTLSNLGLKIGRRKHLIKKWDDQGWKINKQISFYKSMADKMEDLYKKIGKVTQVSTSPAHKTPKEQEELFSIYHSLTSQIQTLDRFLAIAKMVK